MQKSIRKHLEWLLEAIETIMMYTSHVTHEEFLVNREKRDACLMQLVNIGEIVGKIRKDYGDIVALPSKQILGVRNLIAHDYQGIQADIIWGICKNNIPSLKDIVLDEIRKDETVN